MAQDLSATDLAALLCSRVCHDIISPVGAISNGLEVLDEDGGEDMREFAMDLIQKSARQASAKLQFARLAYGAAGSAGAEIDLGDAHKVTEAYFQGEKPDLVWKLERNYMHKTRVKLLLNLCLISLGAIPRGGTVTVEMEGPVQQPSFRLSCTGRSARIPHGVMDILTGKKDLAELDAHGVQPYYTKLLARECDIDVDIVEVGEDILITAQSKEVATSGLSADHLATGTG